MPRSLSHFHFPVPPGALPATVLQNPKAAPTTPRPLDPSKSPSEPSASRSLSAIPVPPITVQAAPPNLLISFLPGKTTTGTQVEDWGQGVGVGRDGETGTWIWRKIQRDGARNWNRDGEIGCSGPDADGDWEMGSSELGEIGTGAERCELRWGDWGPGRNGDPGLGRWR